MMRKLLYRSPRGWLRDCPDCALPGRAITYDRVEDGQQLAGNRDDGDLLWLAGCYEVLEEGLEHRVVPTRYGAHEQGPANARSIPTNEALAAPLPRLAREGSNADKRHDLLAAENPKLRQLGNERARDCRPDTWYRGEQVLLLAPVPKPTTQTGVTAMTLAVLSAFDQKAKGQ